MHTHSKPLPHWSTVFTGLYIKKRSESKRNQIRSKPNLYSICSSSQSNKSSEAKITNPFFSHLPPQPPPLLLLMNVLAPGIEFWNELQNASPKLKLTIKVKVYSQIHKLPPSMPCHDATHQPTRQITLTIFLPFRCHMRSHTEFSVFKHHHII